MPHDLDFFNRLFVSGIPGEAYRQISLQQDLHPLIIEGLQLQDFPKNITGGFIQYDDMLYSIRNALKLDPNAALSEVDRTNRNYLVMGVNYTLALKTLLEIHGINFNAVGLQQIGESFYANALRENSAVSAVLSFENYFLHYVRHILVPILIAAKIAADETSALNVLDTAKDWVALGQKPIAVCTIDKIARNYLHAPATYLVRIDRPVVTTDVQQTLQFDHYQTQGWHAQFSGLEQRLFQHFLPQLREGRVLTPQLYSRLPFLKSFHHHETYLITQYQTGLEAKKLLETLHGADVNDIAKRQTSMQAIYGPRQVKTLTVDLSSQRLGSKDYAQILDFYLSRSTQLLAQLKSDKQHKSLASQLEVDCKKIRAEMGWFQFTLANLHRQRSLSWKSKIAKLLLTTARPLHGFIQSFFDGKISGLQVLATLGRICQHFDDAYDSLRDNGINKLILSFDGGNQSAIAMQHAQNEAVLAAISNDANRDKLRFRLAASGHSQTVTQLRHAGTSGVQHKSVDSIPEDYPPETKKLLATNYSDTRPITSRLRDLDTRAKKGDKGISENQHTLWFGTGSTQLVLPDVAYPIGYTPAAPLSDADREAQQEFLRQMQKKGVITQDEAARVRSSLVM